MVSGLGMPSRQRPKPIPILIPPMFASPFSGLAGTLPDSITVTLVTPREDAQSRGTLAEGGNTLLSAVLRIALVFSVFHSRVPRIFPTVTKGEELLLLTTTVELVVDRTERRLEEREKLLC